jgi:hypothetical protein
LATDYNDLQMRPHSGGAFFVLVKIKGILCGIKASLKKLPSYKTRYSAYDKTHIAAFAEGSITSKNKKHEKITKQTNEKDYGW